MRLTGKIVDPNSHPHFSYLCLFVHARLKMAEAPEKKSDAVKAEEAPKAAQQVKEDIASDPEEDDLSDLDGLSHAFDGTQLSKLVGRCPRRILKREY